MAEPIRKPHHPLWQEKLLLQCSHGRLRARVHHTGVVGFGSQGRYEDEDDYVRAREFRVIARADRVFKITHPRTGESEIVDEVDYVLRHPYFRDPVHAPNGGLKGAWWQIERGDEDLMRTLENMLAANQKNPGTYDATQIAKQGARVERARAAADVKHGKQTVVGIRGTSAGRGDPAPDPEPEPVDLQAEAAHLPPKARPDVAKAMKDVMHNLFQGKPQ
jgi:hypothetical protein